MKKIDLGQAIGILANLGVVGGLIVLAAEVNQANRQAEAAAYQSRITEIEYARQQFALSAHLPAIYAKLRQTGLESLSPEEFDRLASWESARMYRLQGQFNLYKRGFLEPEVFETILFYTAQRQDFWNRLGVSVQDLEFQSVIDERVPSVEQISDREATDW